MAETLSSRNDPTTGSVPRTRQWDCTFALLGDPYRFIGRTAHQLGSEVFATRMLLRPTLCMTGAAAAEVFYDPTRFERLGAAPEPLRATLFGKGTVQGLDGLSHRQRKALFMTATGTGPVQRLIGCVEDAWVDAIPKWKAAGHLPLYRAVQPVLTRAVCKWAGVPLGEHEILLRSQQLTALFDSAASGLIAHVRARIARLRAEAWLGRLIVEARAGQRAFPADTAAHALTWFVDSTGERLTPRVAAAELLNVLRPTVAVSVYIAFIGHALHSQRQWAEEFAGNASSESRFWFVQEVRRLYPFFPAVVARVRDTFEWNDMTFPQGRRVLLDLYGTNHDPRIWKAPQEFRPERWKGRRPHPFEFVPQGGGDAATGHRCPGEEVATQVMSTALTLLTQRMTYKVARQDLSVDMRRLPAIPKDGFVIESIEAR